MGRDVNERAFSRQRSSARSTTGLVESYGVRLVHEDAFRVRGLVEVQEMLRGLAGRALDKYEKVIRQECPLLRNQIRSLIAMRFPGVRKMIQGVVSRVTRDGDRIGGRVSSAWYLTRFHNDGTDQTNVQVRPYMRRLRAGQAKSNILGHGGINVRGYVRHASRERTRGYQWFEKVFEARAPGIRERMIEALTKTADGAK